MSIHTGCSSPRRGLPGGLLAVALLSTLLPAGALAAVVRRGETVTIGPDEVINEDLYVFGRSVLIQGTVHGDLITFARNVEVPGTVDGDVLSATEDARISGQVRGSIRAAARTITIAGQVGEDSVLAAEKVQLEPGARVGRDVFVAANEVNLQAPVKGQVQAAAGMLTLAAPVDGNVRAEVGTLHITDAARISGSLRYRTRENPEISSGATVVGPVERLSPVEQRRPWPMLYVIGWVRSMVGLFALGLLLVLLLPDFSRRVPVTLRQAPWKSLGWGALTFVGLPILAGLIFLVGALFGGWWIGLIALGLYAVALALCFPVVGMFLGRAILDRFGKAGTPLLLALLLGLALLTLAGRVPGIGALIVLATVLFGLGALVLTAARGWRAAGGAARPQPA
jgi:cytoskeletal protein CcmA (bactofilin family)